MGRPLKQTVKYFLHYVGESKTIDILHNDYGNDGYAFWFKLLELLSASEGHFYNCANVQDWKYLLSYTKVSEEKAEEILKLLAEMERIDPELWTEARIIWCQNFIDNLQHVYSKRDNRPTKPTFQRTEAKPKESDPIPENPPEAETEKKPRGRRKKTEEPPKTQFAENVTMTQDEYDKLVEKYGEQLVPLMIEKLDNYKGSSGKRYTSDYRAILSWVADEVIKNQRHGGEYYGTHNNGRGNGNAGGETQFTASTGFKHQLLPPNTDGGS